MLHHTDIRIFVYHIVLSGYLMCRLYFVRASLLYGPDEQIIAPVAIFAEPSRLDSTVGEQRVCDNIFFMRRVL
jgi:hypothetical protein